MMPLLLDVDGNVAETRRDKYHSGERWGADIACA